MTTIEEKRMLTETEAFTYTGLRRTFFREWAAGIGAARHFGRAVRYDKRVIDAALDAMGQEQTQAQDGQQ